MQRNEKDLGIIKRFLALEKMSYMYDVDKIESFDALLDEGLKQTEKDLQKEAGDQKVAQPVKLGKFGRRNKAGRIHTVRKRGKLALDTKKALDEFKRTSMATEESLFLWLYQMDDGDLAKLNYIGSIPMLTPEQKGENCKYLALVQMIANQQGVFSPNYYSDRVSLNLWFENMKKAGKISKQANFTFAYAMMGTKIRTIRAWSKHVISLALNQMNPDFAYLDTDRLKDMSAHSLTLLKANLEKKAQELLNHANEAKNVSKPDDQQGYAYQMRIKKYNDCKKLSELITAQINHIESHKDMEAITRQGFMHALQHAIDEYMIEDCKEEFAFANKKHLILKKLVNDANTKKLMDDKFSTENVLLAKKNKNPNYCLSERDKLDAVQNLIVKISAIPMGPELGELLEKCTEASEPHPDDLLTLMRYGRVIADVRHVLTCENLYCGTKEVVDVYNFLHKPENSDYLEELTEKMNVLLPLELALGKYFDCNGFISYYFYGIRPGFAEKDMTSDEVREEKKDILFNEQLEYENHVSKLKSNLANYVESSKAKNYVKPLYEMILADGVNLDIAHKDDWLKIIKKIAKDGYFKKKTGDDKWIALAAKQMINQWPYSFEDFYAEKVRMDAGKALEATLAQLTIDYKKPFVSDTKHAVLIAETITKHNIIKYTALNTDMRKQLDEALKHSGYNEETFKFIFREVKTLDSGQTIDSTDHLNRIVNNGFAKAFVNRNKLAEGETEATDTGCAAKREWYDKVLRKLSSAVNFKITSRETDPAYIKKNFAYLYGKAKEFAALKEIYDHEKDILDDPALLRRHNIPVKKALDIKNAFGPKKRGLYGTFFRMIEAYAKMFMVKNDGTFDFGLAAKDMKEGADKKTITEKIDKTIENREKEFKRLAKTVDAELSREVLSEKVAKSDEINKTLNAIEIKTSETVFKIVQKKGFMGKLSDVNLLLQTPKLAKMVEEYNKSVVEYNKILEEKNTLITKFEATRAKGDPKEVQELSEKLAMMESAISPFAITIKAAEDEIKKYQEINKSIYEKYNQCHNKDGSLCIIEDMGKFGTQDKIGEYIIYQVAVSKDVARIYKEFKEWLGNEKNLPETSFSAKKIVERFKQDKMTGLMRDLRKLDLYLSLLEVDKQGFKDNNYDLMASFKKQIKKLTNVHKDMPETNDEQKFMKKGVEGQIKEMTETRKFMKEVLKDMDDGPTNPVALLHDYVRLIFLTLKSYGVEPSGEIVEEKIEKRVNEDGNKKRGMFDFVDAKEIANYEADKIGDAHIELEKELETKIGHWYNIKQSKKGKK